MIWKFCETFVFVLVVVKFKMTSNSSMSSYNVLFLIHNLSIAAFNWFSFVDIIQSIGIQCNQVAATATQISINAFSMKTKH